MLRSRTVKVLVALVATMTGGALTLMVLVMGTADLPMPFRPLTAPEAPRAGAGTAVFDLEVPLQAIKWRNVVIHSSRPHPERVSARYHFVIERTSEGDARVVTTEFWRRQVEAHHVYVPSRDWNADSVGIRVEGDFSRQPPSPRQMAALIELVHALQESCNISADHVYLCSDIDDRCDSPGAAFPARTFTARLLRPGR